MLNLGLSSTMDIGYVFFSKWRNKVALKVIFAITIAKVDHMVFNKIEDWEPFINSFSRILSSFGFDYWL